MIASSVSITLVVAALAFNQSAKAASWSSTGSLKTARLFHTSTLLPNGKVLVVGGQAASGVTNRAELFTPATGIWTNTSSMSTNRFVHTATLLLNGKVLVAGGWARSDFTNVLASAELYDPATGSWTNTGSMITRRAYHQAVLLPNGKVLVTGGGGNNFAVTNSAELYDPSTGTWSATGAMTTNRAGFAAVLLSNGSVLAVGGQPVRDLAISSAELYNPSNGLWTVTGSMAHDRADFSLAVLGNGKVLAIGGWDNTSLPAETEVYDSSNGTWSPSGELNTARYNARSTMLHDGKVLLAGGEEYDTPFSSAELYDPSSGTWAYTGSLNTPRRLHSLTLLSNGRVLVAGGLNTSFLSSAELFDSPPGVVTPVTLTGMAKAANGAFQFGFTGVPIPGAAFTVYSSTNFTTPLSNWTARGGVMEIVPGQFQFSDAQTTNNSQRFYNVRLP
jgi:N-acetylneuraminic acid mutarotase